MIAEKIYYYRKKNDLTQEDLANAIGVSAQAVSGWERSCGYPDITLLPGIAHTLGITIDELMGNDEIGVREDIKGFYDRLWNVDEHEKLRMAIEYYRKYPDIYDLADTLIMVLADWGFASQPEYLDLLREACEKVIKNCTDNKFRHCAIDAMSCWAKDDEAEYWLEMNPKLYSYVYGEVLEERLLNQGKTEECRVQHDINNLSLMLHVIGRPSNHNGDPAVCIGHNSFLRTLIRSFGENGEIPDGWVGKYAFITMRNAAGLFGAGQTEEGFTVFAEAIDAYKRLFALPDNAPLDLGNSAFFGDIAIVQHRSDGQYDTFVNGKGEDVTIREGCYFTQNQPYLYELLTRERGWEWFDSVRSDERFVKAAAEAKELSDQWMKEQNK